MPDFSDPVQLLNSANKAVVRIVGEPQPSVSLDDNLESRITLNAANGNVFLRAKKNGTQLLGTSCSWSTLARDLRLGVARSTATCCSPAPTAARRRRRSTTAPARRCCC